jgi:hypothetical protein
MRENKFHIGSWAEIEAGCDIRCAVSPNDLANVTFGRAPNAFEMTFDHEALRALVEAATATLVEMDAGVNETTPSKSTGVSRT